MSYLKTNCIAYYKFMNGAITTDELATYTLTNTNSVASTASGYIGYGADFGNPNTTKRLLNAALAAIAYPITITGWWQPAIVNNDGNLWSLADTALGYYQLKLRASDSHIVFRSNNQTQAADVDTGITAVVGTWYHCAVNIISTTSVTIYINGVATNTASAIFIPLSLDNFFLGALGRSTPIQYYSGLLDEVGFWSRSLTATEVKELYNFGGGKQYPFNQNTSIT